MAVGWRGGGQLGFCKEQLFGFAAGHRNFLGGSLVYFLRPQKPRSKARWGPHPRPEGLFFKFGVNTTCSSSSFPLTLSFHNVKKKPRLEAVGGDIFFISQKSLMRQVEKQKEGNNFVLKWTKFCLRLCILKWGILFPALADGGETCSCLHAPSPHLQMWCLGWGPHKDRDTWIFLSSSGPMRLLSMLVNERKDLEAIPDKDYFKRNAAALVLSDSVP